jgi:hypothetical protein
MQSIADKTVKESVYYKKQNNLSNRLYRIVPPGKHFKNSLY